MRITFVTLDYASKPSGGVKVIYEYANRLVARGHGVAVVHPLYVPYFYNPPVLSRIPIRLHRLIRLQAFSRALMSLHLRFRGSGATSQNWFPVDGRVKMLYVPEAQPSFFPDGDVIFWAIEGHPEKGKLRVSVKSATGLAPKRPPSRSNRPPPGWRWAGWGGAAPSLSQFSLS